MTTTTDTGADDRPCHPGPQRLHPRPTGALETIPELAERWRVSRAHAYALLAAGLPSMQIGRCRRVDPDAADAWLAARQESP